MTLKDTVIVADGPAMRQMARQALAGMPVWIISKASTDGALALLSLARHNSANRQPLMLLASLLRAVGNALCGVRCPKGRRLRCSRFTAVDRTADFAIRYRGGTS